MIYLKSKALTNDYKNLTNTHHIIKEYQTENNFREEDSHREVTNMRKIIK